VAIGAASGALGGALADFGINDQFMKQLSESIQPGSAALFVLIKEITSDKVLDQIKGYGGVVLKTSLNDERNRRFATRSPGPLPPPSRAKLASRHLVPAAPACSLRFDKGN